jgi:hypothetical protein
MDPLDALILEELGKGALQYLGGLAIKGILGDHTQERIEDLIKKSVAEINKNTRKAIDENEIRKIIASMNSVTRNLKDYGMLLTHKDQIDNEFLLSDAILKTSDASSQCLTLGIPAILGYGCAISLNLLARSAFYTLHGTRTAAVIIKNTVEHSAREVNSIVLPYISSLEPAKRVAYPKPLIECIQGPQPEPYCSAWLLIDGVKTKIIGGLGDITAAEYQDAVKEQINILENFRNHEITFIQQPMEKAVKSWRDAANKSDELALYENPIKHWQTV